MKNVISVKNLKKSFRIYKKEEGVMGSIKSLFNRKYEDVNAVNDISFEIQKGEFIGFIGPNGAGKTTTLKMLIGLLYPTSGEVRVLGYTPQKRDRSYLKRISLVMGQKSQLWWDLPASDSFLLNKDIYEIPDDVFKERYHDLSELLEIKHVLNTQVRKLSLGQRMRCELMSSLLHNPDILYLDEPTIGLDVVMQKKLHTFFKEYNEKYQTTVILTSHYMDDVKELCKRVLIINDGRLIYDGSLEDLVKKYVNKKNISFVSNKALLKQDVMDLGDIVSFSPHKITISVDRNDVAKISGKVLNMFDVDDLDINEISLEEVIRTVFSK